MGSAEGSDPPGRRGLGGGVRDGGAEEPIPGDGAAARPPSDGAPSVVHVLDTSGYAGRESVVEQLAAGQSAAGWDVRVAAVVEAGRSASPFLRSAREAGIPLDVLRLPPRAYLEERRRLVDLIRSRDADVMHSHGYRPDVVAASAAREAGAARVSTVHGFVGGGWKNRIYESLQRRSLRGFDAVVAVSDGVASELVEAGVPDRRVHVVRNAWGGREDFLTGSEARSRLGVGPDRYLVGWVGRLSREKGPDVLLEGLRRAGEDDVAVSVVGEGPEREDLARRADELPPGIRVRFHGSVADAYRYFPAFDVFVISSRREGTPMVLLEAMAAGVPVVTTAVGGVPDVVSDAEAVLVPPDDPDALGRAVARLRSDPGRAEALAAAARQRLEAEFGVESWVGRYGEIYREATRVHAGRGDG